MKNNWQTKKLGEVCDIGAGNSAPQKKELFDGGKYPFFRTSDVGRIHFGVIDDSTDKLNEIGIKKLHLYKKGTLLFPKSGASTFLNHRVLMATDGYVSSHLATLKAKDSILVDRFLFYFSLTVDSRNLMQDQNYPSLRLSDIQEINILLPSFHEQRRIVKILDEVFEKTTKAKENAEKNLQNARELFESYLQSVFANPGDGWEEKKLGDTSIFEIIDGDRGVNYPKKSDFLDEGHCLFLNTKNVRPDGFNFDTTMFISKEKDNTLRKGKLQRNDVILTTRGTIGNLAVYDSEVSYENIRINSGMLIFRPNVAKLLPSFLFEVLRSGIMKAQISRHVTGAAQPQLPIKTLINFAIPVPNTLDEQKKIVARLREISNETNKLETIYQKKLADLEELKKSILQKAFAGELAGVCS